MKKVQMKRVGRLRRRKRTARNSPKPQGRGARKRAVPNRSRMRKKTSGIRQLPKTIPLNRPISAIVRGRGIETLAVIQQLAEIPVFEIIVVLEGQDEALFIEIRKQAGVTIIHVPELAPGEFRTIGAALAQGRTLLFVDGSQPLEHAVVHELLMAVERGAGLALVDRMPRLGSFRKWSDADRVRAFANWSMGCPWLHANSVEHLPHAWSREGVESIGRDALAFPALAQERAIRQRLRIVVAQPGRHRQSALKQQAGSLQQRIGDQVEALVSAMELRGARLDLPDYARKRTVLGGEGS